MKRLLIALLSVMIVALLFTGCAEDNAIKTTTESVTKVTTESTTKQSTTVSAIRFTNKYGTSTTKCAHSGCTNYIASSGDTNCCTAHSKRCQECSCYIDEDAMYCMACIENALYN